MFCGSTCDFMFVQASRKIGGLQRTLLDFARRSEILAQYPICMVYRVSIFRNRSYGFGSIPCIWVLGPFFFKDVQETCNILEVRAVELGTNASLLGRPGPLVATA